MSKDSPNRGREWLKRLALMVGGPVVLFLVLELILWALNVAPPHTESDAFGPDFDEASVEQRLGTPGPGGRVVCLGGSTMAGEPFDYEVSMCGMVGDALGSDTTVVNLAGRGLDSNQVLTLARIACRHPQTLVLVYMGHNEFLQLAYFHRGAPPTWLSDLGDTLSRFRVVRWVAGVVASDAPGSVGELGKSNVADEEVYQRFEDNIHGVIDACRQQPLVLSTVVSNDVFRFPRPGRTLRESVRDGADPSEDTWQYRMRAAPTINEMLRRVAKEKGVALVHTEPVVRGRAAHSVFWDHVHIKPDIHRQIAQLMVDTATRQGWIGPTGSPHYSLEPDQFSEARLERARYSMSLDPVWALGLLQRATAVRDAVGRALGMVVATFLADRAADLPARMRELERALDKTGDRERTRWAACAKDTPQGEPDGCPTSCMPWCFSGFMSAAERAEFMGALGPSSHALAPTIVDRAVR